jgi:predicted GNAT family acetyltransferase
MPTIREKVDPNHTLPHVELAPIQVQEWEGLTREKMTITTDGEIVGQCDIVLETDPGSHKAHFDGIEIDDDKRGRGIGMAAYLLAIEYVHAQGLPFETQDYDQTGYSKNIWEKLAQLGVGEVVTPFQPSKVREGRFIGKFRVPTSTE